MLPKSWGFVFIVLLFLLISCNNSSNDSQHPELPGGDSKEALQLAIKQYPDSLTLVQKLIEKYRDEGAYDTAISLTAAQITKDSGNAYLWNMLATLYFENGDTLHAIKSLERTVDIYPLPEYLVSLGTVYAEVKNPRALLVADELLKDNKVKSGKDAMFIKGFYYSFLNDKKKAINYFDSSLALDYTYMFSYREKAIALYSMGKYEEALKVLKRAVTIQNNFDEGFYWMGRCYEKLGKKQDAIQSYQTALLYDKNYQEAREALDLLNSK